MPDEESSAISDNNTQMAQTRNTVSSNNTERKVKFIIKRNDGNDSDSSKEYKSTIKYTKKHDKTNENQPRPTNSNKYEKHTPITSSNKNGMPTISLNYANPYIPKPVETTKQQHFIQSTNRGPPKEQRDTKDQKNIRYTKDTIDTRDTRDTRNTRNTRNQKYLPHQRDQIETNNTIITKKFNYSNNQHENYYNYNGDDTYKYNYNKEENFNKYKQKDIRQQRNNKQIMLTENDICRALINCSSSGGIINGIDEIINNGCLPHSLKSKKYCSKCINIWLYYDKGNPLYNEINPGKYIPFHNTEMCRH